MNSAELTFDDLPLHKQLWSDEDGRIFGEGHIAPDRFVAAAREYWIWTTGDADDWEDHYGDMEPEDVEHLWWRPDPALGLTWDDDLTDVPGEWAEHETPNSRPYTRYVP